MLFKLESGRGTHFHVNCVPMFVDVLAKINHISMTLLASGDSLSFSKVKLCNDNYYYFWS